MVSTTLQGDTLFIERPYARPTNSSSGGNGSSVCLEFGPATLLYVLPYEPEEVATLKKITDPASLVPRLPDLFNAFLSLGTRL